ncbi:DUF4435 domain-containing protein [Asticcacaulis sp.]|uniref:DUF4435 domain-containing protein n=1 Tax=Asticcacaulis sp. TaxID=1872648 RepID=UPI002629A284|nr:DUF4435 domain-containing protein [Asticcacaulis sp.]
MAVLLGQYNPEWELYVEDVSQVNLYRFLMHAAIGKDLPKWFPIPLGGRQQVINRAHAMAAKSDKRRLFLIDADMSIIMKGPRTKIKNLHQVGAYCIENVVFELNSLAKVVSEHSAAHCPEDIHEVCNLQEAVHVAKRYLLPLFILYAIARKLAPTVASVSNGIGRFYDPKALRVKRDQLRLVRREIIKECIDNSNKNKFLQEGRKIRSLISTENWNKYVSGKDYIIPLFHNHCKNYTQYTGSRCQLARSLARHCTFSNDPILKTRLRKLYGFSR